ncbi:MAG: anti-sigma factor [Yoonia sp.]|nr:anti-sigma factor [Yoonia sp.]
MTDDIDTEDEMVLAAEYALGLLSPAEENAIEDLLAVDPELRDQYAEWIESFASLTDDVAPVPPPAGLEDRVNETLFGPPETKQSLFSWLGFSRFWALNPVSGGVVAAAVVLFALGQTNFLRDGAPSFVAEVVSEDESFVVLARIDADISSLQMDRQAGGARVGRALEVWLVAGDYPPISLGVWPNGEINTTFAITVAIPWEIEDCVLVISDEPLGGSQTGAPTGDLLAVGPVTLEL